MIAVGNHALVLVTFDGGLTFSQLSTPAVSSTPFLSVAYVPGTIGRSIVLSGNYGTLLRTTNGGSTWSVPTITPALTSTDTINSIYFATSTLGVAVNRNRVLITNDGGSTYKLLSPTTVFNYINEIYIMPSPVVSSYPLITAIQLYNGQPAYPFSITLSNTGTADANITAITFNDTHVSTDYGCPLPSLIPAGSNATLCLLYDSSTQSAGRTYSTITLSLRSDVVSVTLGMYSYIYQAPNISTSNWFSSNWWIVVVPLAVTALVIYFLVTRRMTHVKQYNRRIKDRRHHVGFWDFAIIHQIFNITDRALEHDDDSDFWSDDSEDDEGEYSEVYHYPDSFEDSSNDDDDDDSDDFDSDDPPSSGASDIAADEPVIRKLHSSRNLRRRNSSIHQGNLSGDAPLAQRRMRRKNSVTSLLGAEDLAIARSDVLQRQNLFRSRNHLLVECISHCDF